MTINGTGIGDVAPCPSVEQMMGIVDSADPCQVANATGQPIQTSSSSTLWLVLGGALLLVALVKR